MPLFDVLSFIVFSTVNPRPHEKKPGGIYTTPRPTFGEYTLA